MKKILLINDLPGYGKVALAAMIPVLSHMKYEVFNLPTAIISNTLDYGCFEILNTTEYMRNTLSVWKQLGFSFNAIATGFVLSNEQTELIYNFCKEKLVEGAVIFCDPIMGDDGSLYNGVSEATVLSMRKLISIADYIVPNYTEAVYLAGMEYKKEGLTDEEQKNLINSLRKICSKSIVITNVRRKETGNQSVIGYDHECKIYFQIEFTEIPVRFPGTGDIFLAELMGNILSRKPLYDSTESAMQTVKRMIERNVDNFDKFRGIPVETCLEVTDV